ncbi:effector-associated domain 2-containing protein [Streptomyces coeruleorubidus]|uniref:VMAP-C domain-containing protein n=1 Tax=Streptomyces coeruleorubidus TaxID=116188 RepID=UPI00340A2E38
MADTIDDAVDGVRTSRIVALLERTRPMGDPELRRQCLEMTGEQVSVRLTELVVQGVNTRSQLYDIVRLLDDIPGGLVALAEAIRFFAPRARSTEAFHRLVCTMVVQPPLSETELREIHDLLRQAPDVPVSRIHQAARGTYERLPPGHEDVVLAFDHLVEANARTDGLFPFMVYVEYVAALAPRHLARRLREWNGAVADGLGLRAVLKATSAGLVPVRPGRTESMAYLAIQIEQADDGDGPDGYLVSSWTKEDVFSPAQPDLLHLACSDGDLETTVERAVSSGEASLAGLDTPVQLEFLLGRDLVDLPVEEFSTHRSSGLPRSLVRHYQTVIRSLERQRDPSIQRVLKRRWRSMRDTPHECSWHACGGMGGLTPSALQDVLGRDRDGRVVAVALLDAPRRPEPGIVHPYDVALREGVPAMLWTRSAGGVPGLGDLAKQLFAANQLNLLAAKVHESRGSDAADAVLVLVDDPDVIYQPFRRYQSPEHQ